MKRIELNFKTILILLPILPFTLLFFRILFLKEFMFSFLIWNLFLALIPLLISNYIIVKKEKISFFYILSFLAWLLFLPNAPYIITDLVHLKSYKVQLWYYDLALIFSFAFVGMVYFIASIYQVQQSLQKIITTKNTIFIIVVIMFACGFGIYLGRFMRWNTWDIITQPQELAFDILHRFYKPSMHPRTWITTITFGVILNVVYFTFWSGVKSLKKVN